MTNSVAPAPRKGEREYPPAVWVCPKCDTKVITHIPTYGVQCASPKHSRTRIVMEIRSDDK